MRPFALERYFARYEFSAKYTLSASDCEALTLQELLALSDEETRRLWQDLKLSYTETLGHPRLLEEIAQLYRDITAEHLIVAAPEELIYIVMNALLAKGDHVLVATPAYQSLHEIASGLGCVVDRWELRPTNDGWKLDLQYLSDHLDDATKLIVVNFPHNPTGHQISADDQREIIRIANAHGVWILSDEMYRGAEFRPEDQLPAVADEYGRGISLWGLSKSFALPGLRIGWLAMRNGDLLKRCTQLRDYLTICNSAPGEVLALIALKARNRILQRTQSIIAANLQTADAFFGRHTDSFAWLKPKAGSVAFPLLKKDVSVDDFCRNLVETRSLLVTPGSLFQHPGNNFRIGLGRVNFAEVVSILEQSL
jgi:aspartate/methionine/tyrosine aminotransferase